MGHTCIQLAKWSGAKVIASGSEIGFGHIREAGADYVFDYRDPDLSKKILDICPSGVDRAIEVEFGENVNLLQKQGFALDTDHTKIYHGLPGKN